MAVLCLLGAVILLFQPYSADWPGRAYAKPARHYIQAALRRDSLSLMRQSLSSVPVAWAFDAAEVFVYPPGHECGEAPIVFRFVGTGEKVRVLQASSNCIGR